VFVGEEGGVYDIRIGELWGKGHKRW